MNIETITALALTSVIIPFFVPLAKDLFANVFILVMNIAKNKPTFKVGTQFTVVVWPNAFSMRDMTIAKVDFSSVYLRRNKSCSLIPVKKRDMKFLILGVKDIVV